MRNPRHRSPGKAFDGRLLVTTGRKNPYWGVAPAGRGYLLDTRTGTATALYERARLCALWWGQGGRTVIEQVGRWM
ncbi:MAG TPA: hypothetical protein VEA69_15495 [Tepidisphaeraceae bacterium]|nr:hypothetical protein [Tepidisphaeraceae bacterium]